MSLSRSFLIDTTAEKNGFSFPIGEANDDGTQPTFMIGRASMTNKSYGAALAKVYEQFALQDRAGIDTRTEKMFARFEPVSRHVLKGWANIPLGDVTGNDGLEGRPLDEGFAEFSIENAVKLFTRLPELFAIIESQAHDTANFLVANREEVAKN